MQVQKLLNGIAERSKEDKFLYSKFFAIGLFRLLELTGAKDPQALGNLVKAMHLRQEAVNRDLLTYKGVLSKLSAAKEVCPSSPQTFWWLQHTLEVQVCHETIFSFIDKLILSFLKVFLKVDLHLRSGLQDPSILSSLQHHLTLP